MPLIWLRVATFLYGLGLLHSLLQLSRKDERLNRVVLPVMILGAVLHTVALSEAVMLGGYSILLDTRHAESLLALLILLAFLAQYWRYRTVSPGVFIFPLVFVLNLAASLGAGSTAPVPLSIGWVAVHVVTVLIGLAALFWSFVAALLYLLRSNELKAKKNEGPLRHLPPLEEIDEAGQKALRIGFPFMTFGLITGMVLAHLHYGGGSFADPKVLFSLLMWGVYLLLLYVRGALGWRGRRVAAIAAVAVVFAILAFIVNVLLPVHGFGA